MAKRGRKSTENVTLGLCLLGLGPLCSRLEKLVDQCNERCIAGKDRRPEMSSAPFEVVSVEKADVFLGPSQEILEQVDLKRVVALPVLEEDRWDDSLSRLHAHREVDVAGIFRAGHLGLTENADADLDEQARFQNTLVELFRRKYRGIRGEESITKSVDWKAKIDPREGPGFFSLCADPSTRSLLEELKTALRDLTSRTCFLDDYKKLRRNAETSLTLNPFRLSDFSHSLNNMRDLPAGRLPSILLLGETGTGKSLLAKWISEALFPSQEDVLAATNIASIPEGLVDTQLFGAVEGSYTGMREGADVPGFFLQNLGKVVFLDEIGDMRPDHQTRLLTYMDGGTLQPVGFSGAPIPAPVILVAATNRPLRQWVASGNEAFRNDLLQRFDCVVEVPPLRERKADRRLLISLLLQDEEINPAKSVERITLDAIVFLERQEYPGNFRELRFTLRRAVRRAAAENNTVLCLRHCIR